MNTTTSVGPAAGDRWPTALVVVRVVGACVGSATTLSSPSAPGGHRTVAQVTDGRLQDEGFRRWQRWMVGTVTAHEWSWCWSKEARQKVIHPG
jgi:hypothetical protein